MNCEKNISCKNNDDDNMRNINENRKNIIIEKNSIKSINETNRVFRTNVIKNIKKTKNVFRSNDTISQNEIIVRHQTMFNNYKIEINDVYIAHVFKNKVNQKNVIDERRKKIENDSKN